MSDPRSAHNRSPTAVKLFSRSAKESAFVRVPHIDFCPIQVSPYIHGRALEPSFRKTMTEPELLSEYLATGSPQAFEQLVRPNAGMVYGAARRMVGDCDLADDVTQAVFILLARRNVRIKGPLAGWLISATYYSARNALKLAARRRHHERQAGIMKLTQQENPAQIPWESYAPALDAALARLRNKDRNAIALRYLRGLSLRDVGLAMGTTEDAARKRVDRALSRLRVLLTRRANAPAATVLAVHLTARGSVPPPPIVLNSILSPPASPGTSHAAKIADKTARMLSHEISKLVAAVAIFFVLAAAGIGLFWLSNENQAPQPPLNSISPPFAIAPDLTESRVPGDLQLTRWDAVLTQSGADAVLRIAQPFQTPSRIYQAMMCNATQLRGAVAGAMDTGNVEFIDSEPYTAFDTNFGGIFEFAHISTPLAFFFDSPGKESLRHVDNDHVKLTLNLPNISLVFNDLHTQRRSSARIDAQATLRPGDALAVLGGFNTGIGPNHYHLIVYEAYRDGGINGYASMLYDAGWWCRNGPAGLRNLAKIAEVWKARATHKPYTAWQIWNETCDASAEFEKPTTDGQRVALVAICCPAKWPYCWWDALGHPVASDEVWINYRCGDRKPPKGLWAMVQVVGPPEESKWHMPTGKDAGDLGPDHVFRNIECVPIGDGSAGLDVGVMVGPWIEIGRIKWGETKTLGGIKFHVPPQENRTQEGVYLQLTRTGVLEDQLDVTAVLRKGHEAEPFGEPPRITITAQDSASKTVQENYQFFDLYDGDVAHFRILKRNRQWIHFTGFAFRPDPPPPTSVTADELQNAEKILSDRRTTDRQAATRTSTN